MKKHYQITVFGKVQGVWFRQYTKDQADLLKVKGFVKNQPDGSVYIEAEADQANMSEFLAWLHTGSPLSRVEELVRVEGEAQSFKKFEIIR